MRLAFDVEADGLLEEATKIHSLVIKNLDTGEMFSCCDQDDYDRSIDFGLKWMSTQATELHAHNGMDFDLPVLRKVRGWVPSDGCVLYDTLLQCQLIWPHIGEIDFRRKRNNFPARMIGKHSLEAWGYRLGFHKGDFGRDDEEAWKTWSPEMQAYCEQDVHLQVKLCELIAEQKWDPESTELEHAFARVIRGQERRGFPFDIRRAELLYTELLGRKVDLKAELREVFPPTQVEMKVPAYWHAGDERQWPTKSSMPKPLQKMAVRGPNKIKEIPFNPGSRLQVADRLKELGWEPTKFTETGVAVVDETTLKNLEFREGKVLADYFLVTKLLGQLGDGKNAWLKVVKPGKAHGTIHGRMTTNGAVTGRCTHWAPNLAQVPGAKTETIVDPETGKKKKVLIWGERGAWGANCRALFMAPAGCRLVGTDASGLELRCLAHYLARYDDGKYADLVDRGDVDIHEYNQAAFGLPEGAEYRSVAKTAIYAMIYGGGNEKLGAALARLRPEAEAKAQKKGIPDWAKKSMARKGRVTRARVADWKRGAYGRAQIESGIDGLGDLVAGVQASAKNRGWLRGLDGRRAHVRKQHAALNTLLQMAGSLLVKKATVIFNEEKMPDAGYREDQDFGIVAHVHDEWQTWARRAIAKECGQLAVDSIIEAGNRFKFRCPLKAEYRVGNNWAETH